MRGTVAGWVVGWLFVVAPVVLAQDGGLQASIDRAAPGDRVDVPAGVYREAVLLSKPVRVVGVDGETWIEGVPAGAPALRMAADGAHWQFIRIRDAATAVRVDADVQAFLGPLIFEAVDIEIDLGASATLFLRNVPDAPMDVRWGDGAVILFTERALVGAYDAASGHTLPEVTATLYNASGPMASYASDPSGLAEVDLPTLRDDGERRQGLDPVDHTVRLGAPGYGEVVLYASQLMGNPGHPPAPRWFALQPLGAVDEPAAEPARGTSMGDAFAARLGPAHVVGGAVLASALGFALLKVALVLGRRDAETARSLWSLLLPLYTRLTRSALLEQPTRDKIHAYIRQNPGVHYRELQRTLDLANGVLAHHLRILLRGGLVTKARDGQALRLYPLGARAPATPQTADQVLAFLVRHPGATGAEVARGLGLSVSLSNYHLARLEADGRIERRRDGPRARAFIRDDARARARSP